MLETLGKSEYIAGYTSPRNVSFIEDSHQNHETKKHFDLKNIIIFP